MNVLARTEVNTLIIEIPKKSRILSHLNKSVDDKLRLFYGLAWKGTIKWRGKLKLTIRKMKKKRCYVANTVISYGH
jgi:hypothetical protein